MEILELKDTICRICLDHTANMSWSEELLEFSGLTYKDCYYKYTQLEIIAGDPYSQMLCKTCSKDLKSSHLLFVKALESYARLQESHSSIGTLLNSVEKEETKEEIESVSEHEYEEKYEPDEFEMLIFHGDEETLIEENIDGKECSTKAKIEKDENLTGTRKRRGARKKLAQLTISPALAQEKVGNNTSKLRKRKPIIQDYSDDDKEFESLSDNEPLKKPVKVKTKQVKLKKEKIPKIRKKVEEKGDNTVDIPKPKKTKKDYEKKLMCSICSKIYSGKTSLMRHEESHNENRERLEVCPHCGIKFFNKRCLYLHLKIHNKNREKKHKCEFCSKAYYNMGALNVHRREHLGQMVPCPICSKEFHRQVDLDRHNLVAHSEVPLHTEVKKKSKYYVFCKDCNKHLLTTSWKAHQAAHLKEPLMKCSICDKDFFNRDTCRYHMQKVHNYKTREEYEQFIIYCKPNRLSHLLLEQRDIIAPVSS